MTRFPAERSWADRLGLAIAGRALYGAGRFSLGTLGVNLTSGSGKLALVAAAILALALGGCGRKTKLDPPPQASVQPAPGQAGSVDAPAQPPRSNPLGLFDPEEDDRPAAVQGQKRRIILDPILD
jgi:predicted small lipoprotein YifL